MSIVEVSQLTKSYPDFATGMHIAIDEISFSVGRVRFLASSVPMELEKQQPFESSVRSSSRRLAESV